MKVLLVRPPAPNKLSFTKILDNEPLELEYLHTVLKECGYDDYLYDGLIENDSIETVIKQEKPEIIAITGYITQEKLMKKFSQIAKSLNPHIKTIIGGVHAQLNYNRLYDINIDYILRSESMEAFIQLIKYIDNQYDGNLSDINGLCYKINNEYTKNNLIPININSLPIPDRSFFYKNKDKFRYLELTEVATIKTAFSCPYDCNFCYCTLLGGGKYLARDLNLVIKELEELQCENVQIVDDDFLVDKDRLWKFIELVKEKNIHKTYICYARADAVAVNYEIVKALADIGFRYFLVGLEAVSDVQLDNYNKKTSVDVNRKCVEVINKTNAECIALMIAPINAVKKDFDNIYDWVVENNLKYVTVSIFTPIPGTSIYDEYKDKITSNDIEDWDFLHLVLQPENMSKSAFYLEYNKLFMKLYAVAKKTGIYDFMDIKFYKSMLSDYLKRKVRDK